MFALEAWRLAHGWSRVEVSARLDALYEADGLAAPRISSAELCRWSMDSAGQAMNGSSTSVACIRHGLIGSALGWTSATLR
jgi:hypothetical protein